MNDALDHKLAQRDIKPTAMRILILQFLMKQDNAVSLTAIEEALEKAYESSYDLYIFDVNVPAIKGFDLLKMLRDKGDSTPTIFITSLNDIEDVSKGFESGADDYLTKPFNREELVARIHAIVRRSKGHAQSIIRTGKIAVNLDAKTVEANGHPVHLTGKEYQMLELLSLRKGSTLTKEMFLNHLYGGMD